MILVGEIRDLETIRTAIVAAQTGHLVFTTLHAGDCAGAIERLVAVFSGRRAGTPFAGSWPWCCGQWWLSTCFRGPARTPLTPSWRSARCSLSTPAVANLIASSKSSQVYSAMESGTSAGMQNLGAGPGSTVGGGPNLRTDGRFLCPHRFRFCVSGPRCCGDEPAPTRRFRGWIGHES